MSHLSPATPEGNVHTLANGIRILADQLARVPERADTPAEAWFIRLLREIDAPHPLYVDATAGVGYWVFLARRTLPQIQVISFEPDGRLRDAYRDHVILNGLFKTGIVLRDETIAAEETHAPREHDALDDAAPAWRRFVRRWTRPVFTRPPASPRTPRSMTLDALVSRSGLDIDLLRLDVADAAIAPLAGAAHALAGRRIHRCHITAAAPAALTVAAKLLRDAGYVIRAEAPSLLVAGRPETPAQSPP